MRRFLTKLAGFVVWLRGNGRPIGRPLCGEPMHKACSCVRPAGHAGACNCSYPTGAPTSW